MNRSFNIVFHYIQRMFDNGKKLKKSTCFFRIFYLLLLLPAVWSGCEKDQETPEAITHYNALEINKVAAFPYDRDTVKFVLLTDIHDNYDVLSEAIEEINQLPDISFVVCCGDLTNFGKESQFFSYTSTIMESTLPFFSVAGNHDYLSTSNLLFTTFLGKSNYSFIWGPYKVIVFDDAGGTLFGSDFGWLSNQADQEDHQNIIIAHKPPRDTDNESDFRRVADMGNTILFLHGHTHIYETTLFNGVPTLIAAEIAERKYYIVSLCGSTPEFKTVEF